MSVNLTKITELILIRDYMATVSGDARIVSNVIRKDFDKSKVEIDAVIIAMLLHPTMKQSLEDCKLDLLEETLVS